MTTADMFASSNVAAPANAPGSALLVTNHLNLMYMLAAGLVMPPEGFGGKHYRDPLADFPGWIPLFVDKAPREAIEASTSEAGHLRPCIVEIGLSQLSGRVTAVGESGVLREMHFPDQIEGTERAILVPAPLPTCWIRSIIFRSADDKRACEADAGDFGNVPLGGFQAQDQQAAFDKGAEWFLAAGRRTPGADRPAASPSRRGRRHGDTAAFREPR